MKNTLLGAVLGVALTGSGFSLAPDDAHANAPHPTFTSISQLRSLPVPSMCDNPAGTLVDGRLPGHDVTLDEGLSRLGQIRKGGGKEAAAVFHCSQGGISWPDHLVFYSADGRVIGHHDLAKVRQKGLPEDGRQRVQSVTINAKGQVTVHVTAVPLKGDNTLWGSAGATVKFAWNAKKARVVRASTKIHSKAKDTAKKVLSLIKAGKTKQARAFASADVVKSLSQIWNGITRANRTAAVKGTMTVGSCGGQYSWGHDGWVAEQSTMMGSRGCWVKVAEPMLADEKEQTTASILLVLGHKKSDKKWKSWYATSFID